MLGVFVSLDFFLFYVFWEVMLLPMYFLIGVWGGPRKEYAAIKFFLYTLLGSVLMLIAILMLYFNSDLTLINARNWPRPHLDREPVAKPQSSSQADATRRPKGSSTPPSSRAASQPIHTFNILALQQIGQHTRSSTASDRPNEPMLFWARACSGGPSCCCSSALPSRCRACRCTRGCPMPTSRRPRRSR